MNLLTRIQSCELSPPSLSLEWEVYARIATSQYKPQLLSRSHYMDWWQILDEVKKEVELVR